MSKPTVIIEGKTYDLVEMKKHYAFPLDRKNEVRFLIKFLVNEGKEFFFGKRKLPVKIHIDGITFAFMVQLKGSKILLGSTEYVLLTDPEYKERPMIKALLERLES